MELIIILFIAWVMYIFISQQKLLASGRDYRGRFTKRNHFRYAPKMVRFIPFNNMGNKEWIMI